MAYQDWPVIYVDAHASLARRKGDPLSLIKAPDRIQEFLQPEEIIIP